MKCADIYQAWIKSGGEYDERGNRILPLDFVRNCIGYAAGELENLEGMLDSGECDLNHPEITF